MGRWQIEAGSTRSVAQGAASDTWVEMLVRYALSQRFELRVGNLTLWHVPGNWGWLDPSVGFKYLLLSSTAQRPEVSVIVQTTVPVGAEAFRVKRSQPTLQLPWSMALDSNTGIGGMLTIGDLGATNSRFTQYGGSIYLSRALDRKSTGYLEIYGLGPIRPRGATAGFADIALTYLATDRTQFDVRLGSGFDQARDGWFVGAGVAYRF